MKARTDFLWSMAAPEGYGAATPPRRPSMSLRPLLCQTWFATDALTHARSIVGVHLLCARVCMAAEPTSAISPPPTARLEVIIADSAADCPGRDALVQEINRVAKRRALTTNGSEPVSTQLTLTITRVDGVYHAMLGVTGLLAGVRSFQDTGVDCTGLARAITASTALLLDHVEAGTTAPPTHTTANTVVPSAPKWAVELGPVLTTGLARSTSFGGRIEANIGRNRFLGALGALWVPARRWALSTGSIELGWSAATMGGCWEPWSSEHLGLRAWTCGRAVAGLVHAASANFEGSRDVHRPWIGLGASLALVGSIYGPLHWTARFDGLGALVNQRFTIGVDGQRQVAYEPAKAATITGLGLMLSNF